MEGLPSGTLHPMGRRRKRFTLVHLSAQTAPSTQGIFLTVNLNFPSLLTSFHNIKLTLVRGPRSWT